MGRLSIGLAIGVSAGFLGAVTLHWGFWLAGAVFILISRYTKVWPLALFVSAGFVIGLVRYQHFTSSQTLRAHWYATGSADVIGIIKDKYISDNSLKLTLLVIQKRRTCFDRWQFTHDYLVVYRPKKYYGQVGDLVYIKQLRVGSLDSAILTSLFKRNLIASTWSMQKIKLIYRPARCFIRWLYNLKNNINNALKQKLTPTAYALFAPMFLGIKVYNERIHNLFARWGVLYYLVRSGIHLILIFFLLEFLLRVFLIPFRVRALLMIIVSVVYAAFTWGTIPFWRALMALICVQLCHLMRLPINALHILNLIFLIVLLHNPYTLLNLDFQLSFGLTYVLMLKFLKIPA